MKFKDKKVLITGGSRGIGKATAHAFAKEGAQLTIVFQSNHTAAHDTLNSLPGGPHTICQTDLRHPSQVKNLIQHHLDFHQRLDVIINNAGVFFDHSIDKVNFEEWQTAWKDTLAVNLVGPANLCYLAAKQMIQQGDGGRIVNVSSRGAFRGEPDAPAYGASKAGLNSMSQSLAKALAPHHIFVGVVAPGFVETEMAQRLLDTPVVGDNIRNQSPMGRVAKPEEVAKAILFLAEEGTEFL